MKLPVISKKLCKLPVHSRESYKLPVCSRGGVWDFQVPVCEIHVIALQKLWNENELYMQGKQGMKWIKYICIHILF